jgi:hypothetical protein
MWLQCASLLFAAMLVACGETDEQRAQGKFVEAADASSGDAASSSETGVAEVDATSEEAEKPTPTPTSEVEASAACADLAGNALPDVTGHLGSPQKRRVCNDGTIYFEVCNSGAQPLVSGVSSAIYVQEGSLQLLCTPPTSESILVGKCSLLSCILEQRIELGAVVVLKLNDDGQGQASVPECNASNNTDSAKAVICDPK